MQNIIIIRMNRIKLDLIKQSTSVSIEQLKQITVCNPYSQGWLSDKFPVYPIIINFHVSNPPFNRISLSLQPPYLPQSLTIQGSSDSKQYFKFANITQFPSPTNIILNLKQNHHYKYLRIKISQPRQQNKSTSKTNICKQVWIKCIQLTYVTFYGCQYVCSMQKSLQLDPCLFRILQLLEYKALLAKSKAKSVNSQKSNQYKNTASKYYAQMQQILTQIKEWKQNPKKLSQQVRQQLFKQIQVLAKQPLQSINANDIDYDRQGIRKQVAELQNQLADFYVHRLNNLHKDVTDYFYRYWNKQVKQEYMRLLSSPDPDDHGKALSNFWAEVKAIQQFPIHIEQAVVMYFNYFLEYVHDPLKITAIKILCLLFRNPGLSYQIYFVYERLLFNLFSQLSDQQKKQLFDVSLKCIYTLFQKAPDSLFIQALLNPQHSVKFSMKLIKLQILQKITFKNVTVDGPSRDNIVDYILDMLSIKQLTLQDKNRAYNVVAYLASLFGKQAIMNQFQKLNTMITMTMQKIVDKKLLMMRTPRKQQETPSCQYCGVTKQSFRDSNLYDLHCFKDCKYLTPCRYCSKIVEIPQLSKHYIHTCQQRNIFKQCDDCNQVIVKAKEDQHKKVCTKQLTTKCGLCQQKMEGKLKLKEHLLKEGCPNNPR